MLRTTCGASALRSPASTAARTPASTVRRAGAPNVRLPGPPHAGHTARSPAAAIGLTRSNGPQATQR
jgi:hypothetical protein